MAGDVDGLARRDAEFAEFYRAGYDKIVAHIRLLSAKVDAEGIANEACARVYTNWFTIKETYQGYAVAVARNLVKDEVKKTEVLPMAPEEVADRFRVNTPGPEDLHAELDVAREVYKAIARLPPAQREPMLLAAQQRTVPEIADALGLPRATVTKYLRRGRARLAKAGLGKGLERRFSPSAPKPRPDPEPEAPPASAIDESERAESGARDA
ncbi:RNA polymerase sigma factor [Actinokineospora alba]|uniref:RNA polymerase sigma factor n=1 Tax=Actinokineospora alba TaxID=504798 RepID=UPI0014150E9D|nr:sigma-70 family RNA polymerase sigma factor [Actinokineospora alba]